MNIYEKEIYSNLILTIEHFTFYKKKKYSKTCINRPPLGPKNMAGMDSWPVYSDMQMTESQGRSMKRRVGKV